MNAPSMIIPETRAVLAGRRIRAVIRAWGGEWVVMFIEDGWVIAPSDSARGRQILRSGSPTIAGVFDQRCGIAHMTDALLLAMRGESIGVRKRTYPSWERSHATAHKRAWRQKRRELGLKVS